MISLFLLGLTTLVAFTDTAVTPEPGTIALLATGLAGIGFAAWRAKRKK